MRSIHFLQRAAAYLRLQTTGKMVRLMQSRLRREEKGRFGTSNHSSYFITTHLQG